MAQADTTTARGHETERERGGHRKQHRQETQEGRCAACNCLSSKTSEAEEGGKPCMKLKGHTSNHQRGLRSLSRRQRRSYRHV